jgi:hypothetical protein
VEILTGIFPMGLRFSPQAISSVIGTCINANRFKHWFRQLRRLPDVGWQYDCGLWIGEDVEGTNRILFSDIVQKISCRGLGNR